MRPAWVAGTVALTLQEEWVPHGNAKSSHGVGYPQPIKEKSSKGRAWVALSQCLISRTRNGYLGMCER